MTNIVFFGTSEFAIPALEKLLNSGYEIATIITQPDKPAGRHKLPLPSPVKLWAQERGLQILQPPVLKIENYELKIVPDVHIVASYGKLLPAWLIDEPKFGTLNLHPSLLPKYRGPSPIQTAIFNDDEETGVTIIKMDKEMDHGPIIASEKLKIKNEKFKYQDLHNRLAELAAELLMKTLPQYLRGEIKPKYQKHKKATFTKLITKNDARIDWTLSASKINAVIRAFHVWPAAWTTLNGKRLKIFDSTPLPFQGIKGHPGEIIKSGEAMQIQCGKGVLQINELQLEGSRRMKTQDFLRGFRNTQKNVMI